MKLPIILEGNRRDGYTATCPALPGCISEGDTREEAIKNVREAIRLYLRAVTREHVVQKKLKTSKELEALEVAV
jgi:predicted RNase H-like HicB family nuclease